MLSKFDYVKMRWVSDNSGVVCDPQASSVVANATIIYGRLEARIDQVAKVVTLVVNNKPKTNKVLMSKYAQAELNIKNILGRSWTIDVQFLTFWQKIKEFFRGKQIS